jgi:hypothetical protein
MLENVFLERREVSMESGTLSDRFDFEPSFIRFAMPRFTPEQAEAYNEGRRNGVLAGILLGSISAAITGLLLWLLLG